MFEERKLLNRNFTQTPVVLRHFYQNSSLSSLSSLSLIKQTHQSDFARAFYQAHTYLLGHNTQFQFIQDFNAFSEKQSARLLSVSTAGPLYTLKNKNQNLKFSLHASNFIEKNQIKNTETRLLPMTFSSFQSSHWHNGNDWASRHLYLQSYYQNQILHDLKLEATALISLTKTQLNIPMRSYSTPFENTRSTLSAIALKASHLQKSHLEALFSPRLNDLISFEAQTHFQYEKTKGYTSLFFHNYFPDPYSFDNLKIRQLQFGLETTNKRTLEYFCWGSIDLNPFKINAIQIGLEQNECCYNQIIGLNIRKEYSPMAQKRLYEYSLTYKVEIGALGFIKLGSQKNLSLKKIQRKKMIKPSKHRGYHL